jgi:hypothetical protein
VLANTGFIYSTPGANYAQAGIIAEMGAIKSGTKRVMRKMKAKIIILILSLAGEFIIKREEGNILFETLEIQIENKLVSKIL